MGPPVTFLLTRLESVSGERRAADAVGLLRVGLDQSSVDARLSDLLTDSLEVFVQLVSDDGADRVLQGARSVTDVAVHGVAVRVVLESVLPDEVSVRHELADGDVLVLVDVGEQGGEVHGLLNHHQIVRDLEERKEEEEEEEESFC